MENYYIEEIIDYICDNDSLLTVIFRLEGDEKDSYRIIETEDYYYYAEDLAKEDNEYITKEWDEGDLDEGGYFYGHFNFREWLEFEHSEDRVKEFIYEHYIKKTDLPKKEYE